MRSGTVIGAGAGFAGGIVAAFVLSILGIKGHEGQITRAITLVSHTVHTDSLVGGWLVQIAVATAIGALFGVLYTAAGLRRESAAFWATIYALAWWIVGWFAVMPPPLRFAPWAAAKDPALGHSSSGVRLGAGEQRDGEVRQELRDRHDALHDVTRQLVA